MRLRTILRGAGCLVLVALCAGGLRAQDGGTILNVNGRTAPGQRAGQGKPPVVTMSSKGGFRWAETESVSVGEYGGKPSITIERTGYEPGQKQGPTTKEITAAQSGAIAKALKDNDALALKNDSSLAGRFTDLPTYTFTVSQDGKSNTFTVLGPMMLKDTRPKYFRIFEAVNGLAEQALPAPQMQ